ncbi:hypothetical protein ACQEVF_54580 [Nonomuraea polychroma]|uniref:hypothetical protein n=1 Tax=Nonomuraea polychroma TaxID=46176 RepID=UPI003D94626E
MAVDHLLDHVLGLLRSEPGRFQFAVNVAAQCIHAEGLRREGEPGHLVGGLIELVQGGLQRLGLLGRRHELHLHHQFHVEHIIV